MAVAILLCVLFFRKSVWVEFILIDRSDVMLETHDLNEYILIRHENPPGDPCTPFSWTMYFNFSDHVRHFSREKTRCLTSKMHNLQIFFKIFCTCVVPRSGPIFFYKDKTPRKMLSHMIFHVVFSKSYWHFNNFQCYWCFNEIEDNNLDFNVC